MNRYPRLLVSREKIRENAFRVICRCAEAGISVAGVVKGVCAHPSVVRTFIEGGCEELADSRMKNIAALREMKTGLPLLLLRIPMPSEIPLVAEMADCSLVSMADTVRLLESECKFLSSTIEVIVMIDLGDLREGLWLNDTEKMTEALRASPRIKCSGVGVNFGCFGGTLPTPEKLVTLLSIGREMERTLGYPLSVFSGGGTSSLLLLEKNVVPEGINHLRIGEGILLGEDVTSMRSIPWLHQKTMVLEAEVVEVRRKPSVPAEPRGADAFGGRIHFPERGNRLRAIFAVGRQDVKIDGLIPEAEGALILGGSSDHLIVDVEDVRPVPVLGDIFRFFPDYGALLALSTSPYAALEMV
ncbi:MAG: alanine/ornithine racemase family PLP-dependent enzyme [Synergistaceae bacterium]|nr:alanine/ornithine racemase family PLP-dependent enzyme [Synergistaceae bacterium]